MRQEFGWIMSKLEAPKRRILILEESQPELAPWPPKPGTMGLLLYQDLGQPRSTYPHRKEPPMQDAQLSNPL